jgi:hypothetical protein
MDLGAIFIIGMWFVLPFLILRSLDDGPPPGPDDYPPVC